MVIFPKAFEAQPKRMSLATHKLPPLQVYSPEAPGTLPR